MRILELLHEKIKELQSGTVTVMRHLSGLLTASEKRFVSEHQMNEYLRSVEQLCIKSRVIIERYHPNGRTLGEHFVNHVLQEVSGTIEVTEEGWLKLTLLTLLPSEKYKNTGLVKDTVLRLLEGYEGELPYFERAFLGIVEYCNFENHRALDNDNKVWKMIPNALKGRVVLDDSQFRVSLGLFTEISEEPCCQIYVLPQSEASDFLYRLQEGMLF